MLCMSAKALGVGQIDLPEVIQNAENAGFPLRELVRENCAPDGKMLKRKRTYYFKERHRNKHRNRWFHIQDMAHLTESEFIRTYRMRRSSFFKLLELINLDLSRNSFVAIRSSD